MLIWLSILCKKRFVLVGFCCTMTVLTNMQWTSLCQHTGIQGFYVTMRGSIEDFNGPKVFFSDVTMKFIHDVLNIEPQLLALKLEAWSNTGLGGTGFHIHQIINLLTLTYRLYTKWL